VLQLGPDLPQVRVDPAQMREVLSNLAGMATQAMTGADRLTIETDACRMTPADRAGRPWLRPGDYVRLRVSDTGRTIAADTLPHLFDPFFLPADAPRGGGLTLSSVYGVVKQSGGYIWADSRLGEGSSVTILLPPLEAPQAPVTYRTREPRAATPRVLLVEDLDGVRDVLASLLELRGFEVVASGSAEEAIELAVTQRFDILLTDVSLPGATGPELAERLHRDHPGMPVLFMSGHPAAAFDSISLTDPRTFLQKPFSADTLAARLRDLLERRPE
jgi:two-component system, cell cycle sensor histidine kinase and response regulator CckA